MFRRAITRRIRMGSPLAKESLGRALQAVLERDLWLPSEHVAGSRYVGVGVAQVAGARRAVSLLDRLTEHPADRVGERVHRLRGAGGDVEDAPVGAVGVRGAQVRLDDVLHEGEVA